MSAIRIAIPSFFSFVNAGVFDITNEINWLKRIRLPFKFQIRNKTELRLNERLVDGVKVSAVLYYLLPAQCNATSSTTTSKEIPFQDNNDAEMSKEFN